jgi:hypothetical protein
MRESSRSHMQQTVCLSCRRMKFAGKLNSYVLIPTELVNFTNRIGKFYKERLKLHALREFLFVNPVKFWSATNPNFFEGTAVEYEARKVATH